MTLLRSLLVSSRRWPAQAYSTWSLSLRLAVPHIPTAIPPQIFTNMQRVLDSSPVNLQPVPVVTRRSLKRTASLASLPTPPRTTHKNKRSRKDVSDQEDKFDTSESEHESSPVARVLFEPRRVASKAKADALSEEAAEDAFWLGEDTSKEKKTQQERPRPSSTIGSAPVSPPPSRTNQVGPRFQTPPPLEQRVFSPVSSSGTPLAVPEEEGGPIRDSPNNLFLVESKKAHPVQPVKDTEEDFEEAPTVKYVL